MDDSIQIIGRVSHMLHVDRPSFAAENQTTAAMRNGAPKGITDTFYRCIDKASIDQTSIGTCIAAERKVQDARLNKAYGDLMGKLDEKPREVSKRRSAPGLTSTSSQSLRRPISAAPIESLM